MFCVWLGWNLNFVRQRRAMHFRLGPALAQTVDSLGDSPNMKRLRVINQKSKAFAEPPVTNQRISRVRQFLGDEPMDFVAVPRSEYGQARSLFPEAWIMVTDER